MELSDFPSPDFKNTLSVVLCVCQQREAYQESRMNEMLEAVQLGLRQELGDYDGIDLAFVYDCPLLNVRPFEPLTEAAPVVYTDPRSSKREPHSLRRRVFMGLVLLEEQEKLLAGEHRLYVISDGPFERTEINELFTAEGSLNAEDRFSEIEEKVRFIWVSPYALETKENRDGAPPDPLYAYFTKHGQIQPFEGIARYLEDTYEH